MAHSSNEELTKYQLLYPNAEVTRKQPVNLRATNNILFAAEYARKFDDCYIHCYTQSFVNGQGLALRKIRSGFLAPIVQCTNSNLVSTKLFIKMLLQHVAFRTHMRIPKGIVITDNNSHGYFHWLCDVLPKLVSIDRALFDEYVVLVPEKFYSSLAKKSLELLQIRKGQIMPIPKFAKVLVNELLIIDHLAKPAGTGNYRIESMQALRVLVLNQIAQNVSKENILHKEYGSKIYISRSDAKYRYLQNEEELIPLLNRYGFSVLRASTLSFVEQVQLFSTAEIVIGMHGAGLSNMLWMPAQTKVAEIRLEEDAQNNCYYSLAAALDLDYYYSIATSSSKETHKANFVWGTEQAEQLLAELRAETIHG